MVMGALLHHEAKAREGDENVAHALCAVASAVADRDVVAVAGQAAEVPPPPNSAPLLPLSWVCHCAASSASVSVSEARRVLVTRRHCSIDTRVLARYQEHCEEEPALPVTGQ